MTEENAVLEGTENPVKQEESGAEAAVEAAEERHDEVVDEIEQIAADMGWNKNHTGDNAVDAKTFIKRSKDINSSMAKRVKSLTRELEALKDGISAIQSNFKATREREVGKLKSEIAALKAERDAAFENRDDAKYTSTNARIESLEEEMEKARDDTTPTAATNTPPKEYTDWVDSGNEWYEDDVDMRVWANGLAATPEYKALPYPLMLKTLTKKAKEFFPEKFSDAAPSKAAPAKTDTKPAASPVASSTTKPKKTRKATAADLSYEQKMIARDFVSQGVVDSLDTYAEMLQEQGRI